MTTAVLRRPRWQSAGRGAGGMGTAELYGLLVGHMHYDRPYFERWAEAFCDLREEKGFASRAEIEVCMAAIKADVACRCGMPGWPRDRAQAGLETGEGSGWPAKCAFRLARIIAVAAVRDSGARPATCGVTTTLSHCSSSGRRGGTLGSPSRTSRPAPAMRFARSASSRAWVSTTVPRPTLTR